MILALLWGSCTAALRGATEELHGLRVAEIRFEPSLQPMPDLELRGLLPLAIGDPLEPERIRGSIAALYATGRYLDIEVRAEKNTRGEVSVLFATRPAWFVGRVEVSGVPEPPSPGRMVSATKLVLGSEYTDDQIESARANLLSLLESNGFHQARVEPSIDREAHTQQVHVRFRIDPGPRARFRQPEVEGVDAAAREKAINATRWKRLWGLLGWRQVTEARVARGLERVRQSYRKQQHLLNRVTLEDLAYDAGQNRITATVAIDPGPQVHVEAAGAKLSRGRLRQLVPIYQEKSADRDLLVEGMRNLTDYFQLRGYFRSEVNFTARQEGAGRQVIAFRIVPGERYRLVRVQIDGNRFFDQSTIRERMNVLASTRLRYRRGRYSENLLARDLDAITELYRSNGFRDARVSAEMIYDYDGKLREAALAVRVEEGTQSFVGALELVGVSGENQEAVRSQVSCEPGQPFSEANLARDRDQILNFYYNHGHPDATFEWTSAPGSRPGQVDLRFLVREGPRRFVRGFLIGGLKTSDADMVYNRIRLESREPLSQSAMIDSQRRLYDLGIFARVDMAVQNPEGNEASKYVLYQFEEARKYSVSVGLGAEVARIGRGTPTPDTPFGGAGFSPRVTLGVSRANLLGTGHTVGVQGRVSNIQRRGVFTYLAPQFKGREDVNLTFTGLYDFSRDIRTFDSRRLEGSVQIGQRLSRANTLQYRFAYRRVTVDEGTLNISPELVPVFAQPVRVGILSGTLIQDRRNDPIDARKGHYTSVDFGVASKAFASQTDYLRLLARNSSYHRVVPDLVLARSFTFGVLHNLRGAGEEIPLPERFFSGGASSHRGFPDNQAGPRDLSTGFPLGGEALLMHSLELRFPLLGDNLGGVLFHDMGNLYSKLHEVNLRQRQRDVQDFDYMVHAAGFGIRYRTPIGPIRLDLAYSANSPRFFGLPQEVLFTDPGRPGRPGHQRISRLQFHFSIGQTF